MPELVIGLLILTLIVVNLRRELWRKRALEYKARLKVANERLDVVRQLRTHAPGLNVTVGPVPPVGDWPEDIDA